MTLIKSKMNSLSQAHSTKYDVLSIISVILTQPSGTLDIRSWQNFENLIYIKFSYKTNILKFKIYMEPYNNFKSFLEKGKENPPHKNKNKLIYRLFKSINYFIIGTYRKTQCCYVSCHQYCVREVSGFGLPPIGLLKHH